MGEALVLEEIVKDDHHAQPRDMENNNNMMDNGNMVNNNKVV